MFSYTLFCVCITTRQLPEMSFLVPPVSVLNFQSRIMLLVFFIWHWYGGGDRPIMWSLNNPLGWYSYTALDQHLLGTTNTTLKIKNVTDPSMKKQLQQVDFRDDDEEDDAGLFTHDRCPQCWSSGATTDELPPIDYNVFQKRKKKATKWKYFNRVQELYIHLTTP